MELISQKTKKIMEGCKERAKDYGLNFQSDTLEYIVTNRDLIELQPKIMIPTMYDYWVHDVEVLKGKGRYELYPNNPYETVINTRPAISFYNDNNPDWLNVMIFYHVLGHIDFFNSNIYFQKTWDIDFCQKALSDKRAIANLRSKHGRWVDYVIEFSRGIDNLVGFYTDLVDKKQRSTSKKVDYYFDIFLQEVKKVNITDYLKEIERYNKCLKGNVEGAEGIFFSDVNNEHPEFPSLYDKYIKEHKDVNVDLLQYIMDNSDFLKKEENKWMKTVMQIVRDTSTYFQPQIRTKIMNEGWASYWHEKLFLQDDRIKGNEVNFAKLHSGVTSMPRVGLNPYALGLRLFYYIEELGNTGKRSWDFLKIQDSKEREDYDKNTNDGQKLIFNVRENLCDFTFLSNFVDQDFMTKHNLFVAGKRPNFERMTFEYFIKSKKLKDYKDMLFNNLYHPPHILIDEERANNGELFLTHSFEGKPLIQDYISNTMMGIEYLWGKPIKLETTTAKVQKRRKSPDEIEKDIQWQRIIYTMKDRELTKRTV